MIVLDNKVVSTDVEESYFVCDLNKCKGACCVEGDLGAPLQEDELDAIEEVSSVVKPYLSDKAVEVLEKEGGYVFDEEGEYSTTTIGGRECVFAVQDKNNIWKCSIEMAWKDGKTEFQKPISCHLYPIRVTHLNEYEALNYDQWKICSPACDLGQELKVPLYKFLKDPLTRKYGKDWYDRLVHEIEKPKKD